jgi:hypothetical protein
MANNNKEDMQNRHKLHERQNEDKNKQGEPLKRERSRVAEGISYGISICPVRTAGGFSYGSLKGPSWKSSGTPMGA